MSEYEINEKNDSYIHQEKTQEIELEENKEEILSLISLRNIIEKMNKFNQIEILRIFNNDKNVTINENKNGIYINLTDLNDDIINKLSQYITYVNKQESQLVKIEKQKESFKNTYFPKDNKDILKYKL